MKIKSFLALLLAFVLIFTAGCGNSDEPKTNDNSELQTDNIKTAETIRLLYSSKDTLDPYTCVTEQNAVLSQFIYEPLLVLNNNYEIEYRLADSVTVKGNICNITIKSTKFSDGSNVTTDDIIFSFNKAKKSKTTRHAQSLKYAKSIKATDSNTLTITLSRNDDYFANLLTFPILKSGSDSLKDEDNRLLPPIGSGRYVFNLKTEILTQNPHYYGKKSPIKKIQTVDCPDNESVDQAVTANMIDLYFTDLSNNVLPKMNGNAFDISQTRLVFLGVNSKNPQLSNSLIRQAISTALNREEICTYSYYSKATPALGPVPSNWEPANGLLSIQSTPNLNTSAQNIELAGYTNKDKNNFYTLKNGNTMTFRLLVNSNNESRLAAANKIAKDIEAAGIKIKVNAVKESTYRSYIKSGNYDLYLGEIRFEENMDIGGLTSLDSAIVFSGSKSKTKEKSDVSLEDDSLNKPGEITLTSAQAYNGYYKGKYTLQDLITAFTAELPVIPICFKNGLVIYSERFGAGITPSRSELFNGIQYLK